MTLCEFQTRLQKIRARNGWTIEIECCGVWIFTVFDKDTGKQLGTTGGSNLSCIFIALEKPFDHSIWTNK